MTKARVCILPRVLMAPFRAARSCSVLMPLSASAALPSWATVQGTMSSVGPARCDHNALSCHLLHVTLQAVRQTRFFHSLRCPDACLALGLSAPVRCMWTQGQRCVLPGGRAVRPGCLGPSKRRRSLPPASVVSWPQSVTEVCCCSWGPLQAILAASRMLGATSRVGSRACKEDESAQASEVKAPYAPPVRALGKQCAFPTAAWMWTAEPRAALSHR